MPAFGKSGIENTYSSSFFTARTRPHFPAFGPPKRSGSFMFGSVSEKA